MIHAKINPHYVSSTSIKARCTELEVAIANIIVNLHDGLFVLYSILPFPFLISAILFQDPNN